MTEVQGKNYITSNHKSKKERKKERKKEEQDIRNSYENKTLNGTNYAIMVTNRS